MNNKGFTLIELMISVALVSVVMIFTLNLLNDIRSEEEMGSNKTADLTNRTIITKQVQADFDNHQVVSFGSASPTFEPCGFVTGSLASYDLYVNKCIFIRIDNGCRAIILGSENDTGTPADVFAYAKKTGADCTIGSLTDWTIEKWKLSSAKYKGIYITQTNHTIEPTLENVYSGNWSNYSFVISVPAVIDQEYSNTSMNFDLEFIYYTPKTTYLTTSDGNNEHLGFANLPLSLDAY